MTVLHSLGSAMKFPFIKLFTALEAMQKRSWSALGGGRHGHDIGVADMKKLLL